MAYKEESSETLTTLRDKPNQTIVVRKVKVDGKEYVDIRTRFINENDEWVWTQKGVRLTLNEARTLVDVLHPIFN